MEGNTLHSPPSTRSQFGNQLFRRTPETFTIRSAPSCYHQVMKSLFERRLDECLKRVDPELPDHLRPNAALRARCATVLANAHIRAARKNRVAAPRAYVELLEAASVWSDPYAPLGRRRAGRSEQLAPEARS